MPLNFDHVILEKEQEDLLIALVEAARKQPRDQREEFMLFLNSGRWEIYGLSDYRGANKADVEILASAELLIAHYDSKGTLHFSVTPLGFRYYEHLMKSRGTATERVEESVFRYLDSAAFAARHPDAFAKWQQAEVLLWSSDSTQQHTAIGHHCREAMQFFATSLVEAFKPDPVDSDTAKTVSRIRAVLGQARPTMSDRVYSMLDALLHYWGTVTDLTNRQEHGAQKENRALSWEDSRRQVFQTAIVMFEFDRTLLA